MSRDIVEIQVKNLRPGMIFALLSEDDLFEEFEENMEVDFYLIVDVQQSTHNFNRDKIMTELHLLDDAKVMEWRLCGDDYVNILDA